MWSCGVLMNFQLRKLYYCLLNKYLVNIVNKFMKNCGNCLLLKSYFKSLLFLLKLIHKTDNNKKNIKKMSINTIFILYLKTFFTWTNFSGYLLNYICF